MANYINNKRMMKRPNVRKESKESKVSKKRKETAIGRENMVAKKRKKIKMD
jgi:hypothetical protein